MRNVLLGIVWSLDFWCGSSCSLGNKSGFSSFLIQAHPGIEQASGHMIVPTDLGQIVGAFRQQMNHLEFEFPGIGFLLAHNISPYARVSPMFLGDRTLVCHLSNRVVWFFWGHSTCGLQRTSKNSD